MTKTDLPLTIFWFRRDLRLKDNKGLFHALKNASRVLPVFIFDEDILSSLPKNDHRVEFFHGVLKEMHKTLRASGSSLLVKNGKPLEVFRELLETYDVGAVYCNADHEPYGINRDEEIAQLLDYHKIPFYQYLDHLVFEKDHVLKSDGTPYKVFTPYSRQWKEKLSEARLEKNPSEAMKNHFIKNTEIDFPSLQSLGFKTSGLKAPPLKVDREKIRKYDKTRDYPHLDGTSRLGVHLRFGTVSIRQLLKQALKWNETFVNELIWREFYAMILWHFPEVVTQSFKSEYDRIQWRNQEEEFERWKTGTTGYPMVDAGMRQLNNTGYMHNRLRMVTASFLTKHLLVDWRWGEAYFGEKLFDYELSSNNGGWQWSAGTGCDAAPYFRIFNPAEQQKKFDPEKKFIKKWIPELETDKYPGPMVDHNSARERCLKVYKAALEGKS